MGITAWILIYFGSLSILLLAMSTGWIKFSTPKKDQDKEKWYDRIKPRDF